LQHGHGVSSIRLHDGNLSQKINQSFIGARPEKCVLCAPLPIKQFIKTLANQGNSQENFQGNLSPCFGAVFCCGFV